MLVAHAGAGDGRRRLAGHRHRRQHGGVLVDAGCSPCAPLPGVPRAARVPPDRAAHRGRRLSRARRGSSSRTCEPRLHGIRRADRVPHGAAQRRRGRPHRAGLRAAGVGRLLLARWACGRCWAGVLEPGEVATARRLAGGRRLASASGNRGSPAIRRRSARTVRVNGVELTVVGVLPDGFQGTVLGLQFDLWVPATMAPVLLGGSRELDDRALARLLRDGAAAARRRWCTRRAGDVGGGDARRWRSSYPESNRGVGAEVLPFWRAPRGPQRMFLQALERAAGADAGVAARGVRQHRDAAAGAIGVAAARARRPARHRRRAVARRAAAAGRDRWCSGLFGAGLGAVLATWGVQALRAVPLTTALPIRFQTSVDVPRAGGGARARCRLRACWWRCCPALQVARLDVSAGVAPARSRRRRAGGASAAMAVEVGLAMVVLIVAGLFLGALRRHPRHRSRASSARACCWPPTTARRAAATTPAPSRFVERAARPAATLARRRGRRGIATSVPLDIHGLPQRAFVLEGRPRTDGVTDRARVEHRHPRLLRGDGHAAGSPATASRRSPTVRRAPQVVVNQAFVDRYLPDGAVHRPPPRPRRSHATSSAGVVRDLAVRRLRRGADAGAVLLLPRPSGAHRRAARAHAPGRRGALAGAVRAAIARPRSGVAGLQPAHARRARRDQPAAQAHSGAAVPGAGTAAARCWRPAASTPWSPTRCRRGAPRSACGWRSAPPAARRRRAGDGESRRRPGRRGGRAGWSVWIVYTRGARRRHRPARVRRRAGAAASPSPCSRAGAGAAGRGD